VTLIENWVPACNPESKPPGLPPLATKYVQGAAKEDCVTEWEMPLLKANRVSLACNNWASCRILGEEECHNGTIGSSDVGRTKNQGIASSNINL
jgi:hypothetical protein